MSKTLTTTRAYDAAGVGNLRVLRIVLMLKLLRLDQTSGSPAVMDLLGLSIRHYLGGYIAIVTVKYESQWRKFLRQFRHRREVLARRAGLIRDKLLGRL